MSDPIGGIWAMKSGDRQPTNFASTASALQAAIDYAGIAGQVYIGPGTISGITNLTVYGKQFISGAGPTATLLVRSAAATGIAIREKTAGEGNASGATGIILKDFSLYGNGSSGDGISLGNQGGASFTSNAYLSDVLVRDFLSGTGIELVANAVHSRDVWSINNNIGFYLHDGGANHWSGFWAEACVLVNVRTKNPWDTWTHLQLEQNGRVPSQSMLEVGVSGGPGGQASGNKFFGLYMGLETGNASNLIIERSGVTSTVYQGIQVAPNGHTYTNTIYDEVWTSGTGARDRIAFRFDTANSERGIFYDKSTNGSALTVDGAKAIIGSIGLGIQQVMSNTASLNFDLTAVVSQDLTITVTGAADGDPVFIGVPNGSVTADTAFFGWVSAANTVTIRAYRLAGTPNPASGTFRATVFHF